MRASLLLLPLLLALSQHGAWLHQLSHAAYAADAHQVQVQQVEGSPDASVCPSCQSFAQLGSALTSSLLTALPVAAPLRAHRELLAAAPPAVLPAPRNRGPPHLV